MVWRDGILLGSAVTRPSGNRRRLPAKCVRGVAELVCRRSGCEAVAAPGRIRLQSPAREGISAAATRSRTRSPQRRRTLPAMSALAGIARFPRARLGHAPTPLETAPNLGAALGIDLYVKRDDCTGLAFGGNKVRQLEFHFGEARARDADTVLVTRSGSRHSRMQPVSASARPSRRSAARSSTSPPSDEIDPPAKSAVTFLRCTAGRSNGRRVSSVMAGVALSLPRRKCAGPTNFYPNPTT